jgi:hypothetical protein
VKQYALSGKMVNGRQWWTNGGKERSSLVSAMAKANPGGVLTTDLAWAIGLFEGEGCITMSKALVQVSMRSTDKDVMERFVGIIGAGTVRLSRSPSAPAHHKDQWAWQLVGGPAEYFLRMILPWLCERRRGRAEEVLGRRRDYQSTLMYARSCVGCGAEFCPVWPPNGARQTHCSKRCYRKWQYQRIRAAA